MYAIGEKLAERLKQLRIASDLPLQELADRSGVSRATLSRIENREVSPTAEVLGRLAAAYGMTITRLLAPVENRFTPLVSRAAQNVWRDEASGFTRTLVSPPGGALQAEVIACDLEPNRSIAYPAPPVVGQEHHLVVLEGALTVTIEGQAHDLSAGDCLRYQLFGASRFRTGASAARYLLVLV